LRPVEAIWKNYDRLDSLGRGYVGNLVRFSRDGALGTALLMSAHICKYLPRWRIVEQGKLHSHALGSFVDVTSKLHWHYKEASLELRGSFVGVTRKFRWRYWEVS
jgi:hypothetical protein